MKILNKSVFVIFILLFVSSLSPVWAQMELYGRIMSDQGQPVEFANIGILNDTRGAVSDAKGNYRLRIHTTDSITLRISSTGYQSQEIGIKLRAGERRLLDISLHPTATQLDVVVVTDDRTRTSTFTQIDIQKIENTVGPNDGVEALLKTLPDVNSNNELSSQYSVRGGSFDENLVYINGVEVFRPQLIRSGQQEGMSIINPDMVDHLLFSPGGFDASYGDKLSSVLDIIYSRPQELRYRMALSFLGGSASLQGRKGERFAYSLGFRLHNNSYIFRSLETDGTYKTSYADLQSVLSYRVNEKLDLSLLTVFTRNRYGLIPSSRTTTFGTVSQPLELEVFFDGQEVDQYNTLLGAFTMDYHPNDDFQLRWITSFQQNHEREEYDIQDQYWLYEIGVGESADDTNRFDRGVGTFLEHARNYLDLNIYATELKAVKYALLGSWSFGLKGQLESIRDHVREWKWVDSAGYAFPTEHFIPGVDDTVPFAPILQLFSKADNSIATFRSTGYVQRELNLFTRHDHQVKIQAGARAQYYTTQYDGGTLSSQFLVSPRFSINFKPNGKHDLLYRLAAGIYQQPYLYREIRRSDGSLCANLPAQNSYQATGTVDWNVRLWDKPFRFTADLYYKYITNLIPYTIDNLRVRYLPDENAVAYATGLSLRINGDFVEGLESWASISLMQTQEDILGDNLGWIRRPTDQRLSFKLFFQDYLPTIPWWRMSLSFLYGTRTPVTHPYQTDRSIQYQLPPYFRVDLGNTIQLTRFEQVRQSRLGRFFDDILVSVEVFNLFNYHNVVSYIWVADYSNIYRPVPNYLTARQLNLKLTATF